MKKLSDLKSKTILILGFGREGQDTYRFLRRHFPDKRIAIADQKEINIQDKNTVSYSGSNYLKHLRDYQIIFKTPGIKILTPEIQQAISAGQTITSQAQLFFDLCPGTIIGVTGTKGKSTTASLIFSILKQAGKKVQLVGNIGQPVLSKLETNNEIFVYELSSFQLQSLHSSPHIAIVLGVETEHLDYHQNNQEYIEAKANIARFQTQSDFIIYNQTSVNAEKIAGYSPAKHIPYRPDFKLPIKPQDIPLPGKFNLNNIVPAVIVSRTFQIKDPIISQAIKNFKPLEHRLEFIGQYYDIKFYDDSIATTPISTIAAIDTLGSEVQTILLGGSERFADFSDLAKKILSSQIKTVILFPTTGQDIWTAIEKQAKNQKLPQRYLASGMKEAVAIAFKRTEKNKICLLSPAAPSFSIFNDYVDRGNQFRKYAQEFPQNH